MYISAMWVRDRTRETGVNVYAYRHPDGLPLPLHQIPDQPGPEDKSLRAIEIRPGGNAILASLDVVLPDEQVTPELKELLRPLGVKVRSSDQLVVEWSPHDSTEPLYLRFTMTLSVLGGDGPRAIFEMLSSYLDRWARQHQADLIPRRGAPAARIQGGE